MTPYHTIVNNVHNFLALNFRTGHAVRKYFNSENFPIYGIYFVTLIIYMHMHIYRSVDFVGIMTEMAT